MLRSKEIKEVEEEERVVEKSRVITRTNRDKVKEYGVKEKSGVL